MRKPIVALVGRPNVGKSTLFNRLVGQRRAIVEDVPGTTRDRLYADAEWNGVPFAIVDTGGLEVPVDRRRRSDRQRPEPLATASKEFVKEIRQQAQIAIDESDLVLLLVDAQAGLTPADEDVAAVLRRTRKPVLVVANKAESLAARQMASEFYALGLGEVYAVSALHGIGTGDLLDALVESLPVVEDAEEPEALKIAVVGRPNVGKSSLLNRLLGQERSIVSAVPGTTRDAIDTHMTWDGQPVTLIDTAGIRRRGKVEPGVEKYSVLRALKAIQRADVVFLLLDAQDLVTAQDAHVAGYVLEALRSVVVVVNKWDLISKDTHTADAYTRQIRGELRFLDYVPVVFVSALTGQRVHRLIPMAAQIREERRVRIPTGELNRLVEAATLQHPPPHKAGKRLKIFYATQAEVDPPTFVFFVNDRRLVHFSYQRYLENQIRRRYPYVGTPLQLGFRNRAE
jgi:GTP-binding protein